MHGCHPMLVEEIIDQVLKTACTRIQEACAALK